MTDNIKSGRIADVLRERIAEIDLLADTQEVSSVTEVGDGIARVSGLEGAMAGELLQFTSSATGKAVYGLAQNLDNDEVGAVLFGEVETISEGNE